MGSLNCNKQCFAYNIKQLHGDAALSCFENFKLHHDAKTLVHLGKAVESGDKE